MSKSSINFQKSNAHSLEHMSRKSYTSYLLSHSKKDYEYKHYCDADDYLKFAIKQTKILTKRKMQKLAKVNFIQEAVLNLKSDTKIEDIENLFKKFNKEFNGGFKLFDAAIHRDEGVFVKTHHNINDLIFDSKNLKFFKDDIDVTNEVIIYAPNRDIFYNKDDKRWYKEKDFKHQVDTSKLQKKLNEHAHIRFTKWDESTGKNIRLKKSDLQKIQTITSESLGMQRGVINSKRKRLSHYQLKDNYAVINKQKEEQILQLIKLRRELESYRKKLKEKEEKEKKALENLRQKGLKTESHDTVFTALDFLADKTIEFYKKIREQNTKIRELEDKIKTLKNEESKQLNSGKNIKMRVENGKSFEEESELKGWNDFSKELEEKNSSEQIQSISL